MKVNKLKEYFVDKPKMPMNTIFVRFMSSGFKSI